MAKSTKLEDYWKQNNIESLFKDLTHILVQRMPADPVLAIAQHLQKKFPKSVKLSSDEDRNASITQKASPAGVRSRSITSPQSGIEMLSTGDPNLTRRSSIRSQGDVSVAIPTMGSAFTDLLKQGTSNLAQTPAADLRNIVLADRFSRHVIKLGKNVQSDHDILTEELIGPTRSKDPSSADQRTTDPMLGDDQQMQMNKEPSTKQLIEYKQHIQTANSRRLHREKLAKIAQERWDQEQLLGLHGPLDAAGQQRREDGLKSSQIVPDQEKTTSSKKPVAKSREEEELLNEEADFGSSKRRQTDRNRSKITAVGMNMAFMTSRGLTNPRLSMGNIDTNTLSTARPIVCKLCGQVIENDSNRSIADLQQAQAPTMAQGLNPQQSVETGSEIVDDWFESASVVSSSHEMPSWPVDEVTPTGTSHNPFQAHHFRPIDDQKAATGEKRSKPTPMIVADDENQPNRFKSPRMSESDVFVRTPEPEKSRPPSSRSLTSPTSKKEPSSSLRVTTPPFVRSMMKSLLPSAIPEATSATTTPTNTESRMASGSVREQPPK